jgi:hypothetical protein
MDITVSFITSVVFPWTLGGLVQTYETTINTCSLVSIILTVLISYIGPIFFYRKCVTEGSYFETNFRLSLQ